MDKDRHKKYRKGILADCRDLLDGINNSSKMVCDCCLGYGFDKSDVVRIESGQMMCSGCMEEFLKVSGDIASS
jgi:hypothetical protein